MREILSEINPTPRELDLLIKKFGPEFIEWLDRYSHTANFFMFYRSLNEGGRDAKWSALLSLGYAFIRKQ